jgi:SAM-dependent methyltransferase
MASRTAPHGPGVTLRLGALLAGLGLDLRVSLTLGCGTFPEAGPLCQLWPQAQHIGLDWSAGRGVGVQAAAGALPFAAHSFDLILLRHPDIGAGGEIWGRAAATWPRVLRPGGALLISTYELWELEFMRAALGPGWEGMRLGGEAPPAPDLSGADRWWGGYTLCPERDTSF